MTDKVKTIAEGLTEAEDLAFLAWWQEIENFSTRGERAFDTLGDQALVWCLAAFKRGIEVRTYLEKHNGQQ